MLVTDTDAASHVGQSMSAVSVLRKRRTTSTCLLLSYIMPFTPFLLLSAVALGHALTDRLAGGKGKS